MGRLPFCPDLCLADPTLAISAGFAGYVGANCLTAATVEDAGDLGFDALSGACHLCGTF
ncbi:MAG: hypothetical protein JKY00_08750 [Roseicyclus sp.]|nr:hypothetical protein [Roseicyclus sp.]